MLRYALADGLIARTMSPETFSWRVSISVKPTAQKVTSGICSRRRRIEHRTSAILNAWTSAYDPERTLRKPAFDQRLC